MTYDIYIYLYKQMCRSLRSLISPRGLKCFQLVLATSRNCATVVRSTLGSSNWPWSTLETVQKSSDPCMGAFKLCNRGLWGLVNCATIVFGPCKLCNCRLWGLVNYATVVFGALHTVQLSSLGLWGLANRATVSNSRPWSV